ncbi:MAG: hypothetical protein JNM61_13010 [Zoogloeaceae bacterium]|nr:hypothetical protein [Zoogloeaceae bacterium]
MNLPDWVLACAGKRVDQDTFDAMRIEWQTWWLETVRHLWEPYVDLDD